MKKDELVSAIITTHNRKHLLQRAIDSVFAQTYSPIELIVVDDSSDDGTSEVCQDARINYIYIPKEESRGGNYARNLGIRASKGEYCAFLDDDDEWFPSKIEKQVKLIQEKQCSLVYCLRIYQDVYKGEVVRNRRELRPKPSGDLHEIIFKHYITSTSCIVVKKNVVEEIGGFDENLRKWQEYDLMIRVAQKSPIYYVDEFLCQYRNDMDDTNRVSNDINRMSDTVNKIKSKYAKQFKNLSIKTRFYFFEMCIYNTYKLSIKTGQYRLRWKLFFPYIFLTLFKVVDDPVIMRKYIEYLKIKLSKRLCYSI